MANSVDFKGFTLRIGNQDGPPETFTKVGKITGATWDTGQANVNNATTSDSTAVEVRPGLFNPGTYVFEVIYFPTDAGQVLVKALKATPDLQVSWELEFVDDEDSPQTYTTSFEAFLQNFEHTGEQDGIYTGTINLLVTGLPTEAIV